MDTHGHARTSRTSRAQKLSLHTRRAAPLRSVEKTQAAARRKSIEAELAAACAVPDLELEVAPLEQLIDEAQALGVAHEALAPSRAKVRRVACVAWRRVASRRVRGVRAWRARVACARARRACMRAVCAAVCVGSCAHGALV